MCNFRLIRGWLGPTRVIFVVDEAFSKDKKHKKLGPGTGAVRGGGDAGRHGARLRRCTCVKFSAPTAARANLRRWLGRTRVVFVVCELF